MNNSYKTYWFWNKGKSIRIGSIKFSNWDIDWVCKLKEVLIRVKENFMIDKGILVGVKDWLLADYVLETSSEQRDGIMKALLRPLDKVMVKGLSKVKHGLALDRLGWSYMGVEFAIEGKVSSMKTTCLLVIILPEEESSQR